MKKYDDFVIEQLKKDKKFLEEYIKTSLEDFVKTEDIKSFCLALSHIVEIECGFTRLSNKTGLSRQTLYNILHNKTQIKLKDFLTILNALKFQIDIKPYYKKVI